MKTATALFLAPGLLLAIGCAARPRPAPATAQAAPAAAAPTTAQAASARAAVPAPAGPRSPDAVLADAVQATGGAAAWNAHKTVRVKVTMTFAGMAIGAPADHYQTRDGKALTVATFPGLGLVREGSNGKVFWKEDPLNGRRILDGAEAEQSRMEDAWNLEMEARSICTNIETVADAGPGLECLRLTLKAGPPYVICYDRQTHLQVSLEGTSATPQGDVPFHTKVSDWRSKGGVKMPYLSETQAGPALIVNTTNEVAFDVPVDDKMFELPAAGTP